MNKKKINVFEDESFNLKIIDLYNDKMVEIDNTTGIKLIWYGKRLTILRLFYNKSIVQLSVYLKTSTTIVNAWEKNKVKPNLKQIEKLEFLFNVSENFFTKESVKLEIIQQLKINEI